jgi:hypothetical protein
MKRRKSVLYSISSFIWRIYKSVFKKRRKIVPHHDSQSYSHYQISQQALRDARNHDA